MPRLVVGALVDQGRLARITLPDGAEVLRSTAAGSLEQLAVRLDDELAPILHQHRLSIYPGQPCHCHPRRLSIYAETAQQGTLLYLGSWIVESWTRRCARRPRSIRAAPRGASRASDSGQ